jgi:hypothetical protein
MNPSVLVVLDVVLLAAITGVLAVCRRELRALRRGLGAVDEAGGRRAATLLAGLQALREPIEALRAGMDDAAPDRRSTIEVRPFSPAPSPATPRPMESVESTGLRLDPFGVASPPQRIDLPRAADGDRESDGETRVIKPPTAAELAAAGAVPDSPALAAAGLGRPRVPRPGAAPHPPPRRVRTQTGTLLSMPAQAQPPASGPQVLLRAVCRMCEGSGIVRARSSELEGCRGCDGAGYVDPSAEPAPGVVGRDAQLPG